DDAPKPPDYGDHPFILEFPLARTRIGSLRQYRRRRDHRAYSLLLNVLLNGSISIPARQQEGTWGVRLDDPTHEVIWVQKFFFAKMGSAFADVLSLPAPTAIHSISVSDYYARTGNDGSGLSVPADLDKVIFGFQGLSRTDRDKFNRAAFWFYVALRQ